jgi:glycosyltransferase involved in cell wall biosynthesis
VKRRLVLLTEIISPYRIPLFNALAQHPDVDLHVVFLAETDPSLRQWQIYKEEIQFSYQVLPSWRRRVGRYNALLNRGLVSALEKAAPDVLLCGGYNYVASWQALFWARRRRIPFSLWSESNAQDLRRGYAPVEFLKDAFLRRCDAFVVPGRSAQEYLRIHEIKEDIVFVAPNAVDNGLFARAAALARENEAGRRAELCLPSRYFLFVGRLVREKGVFELLSAYAKLDAAVRQQIGLVFVGEGSCREQLEKQASSIAPGAIRFAGFAQRDEVATYYALADIFILPTYTDPWGLVVNEAMACGLPVILSRAAGCAADLVKEDWNRLLVPPGDEMSLRSAMDHLATRPDLCSTIGRHSREHICLYSPMTWSHGIAQMVGAVGAKRG